MEKKTFTILIERWKREAYEFEIEAEDTDAVFNEVKDGYFDGEYDYEFEDYGNDADYRDEKVTVYDEDAEEELGQAEVDSNRNVFNRIS